MTAELAPVIFLPPRAQNARRVEPAMNAIDDLFTMSGGLTISDPVLSDFEFTVSPGPGFVTAYIKYCYDNLRDPWLGKADAPTAAEALWDVTAPGNDDIPFPSSGDVVGMIFDRMVGWVRHHRNYCDPDVEAWIEKNWGPGE